ncbi:MAG: Crp/Fnr family transcriptional regulator [Bacteroidota bacterium]
MHPLQQHITAHTSLETLEFERLLAHFEPVDLSKGQLLIEPGNKVEHQYFVLNGCLRTFMIDSDGKEHTLQFAIENWWVSDYISYYKETVSICSVECIEDCSLLKIRRVDLEQLFNVLPQVERFFRRQLERAFVAFQLRILSNLHKTAEERYHLFIRSYPHIEQRVKNYQIASYLGITPESLSRLRKLRLSTDH